MYLLYLIIFHRFCDFCLEYGLNVRCCQAQSLRKIRMVLKSLRKTFLPSTFLPVLVDIVDRHSSLSLCVCVCVFVSRWVCGGVWLCVGVVCVCVWPCVW